MANLVYDVLLTEKPLEPFAAAADLGSEAGAIVDFWGVVRNLEDGREIEGIEYEAHESMARHQMQKIAQQAAADFELKVVVLQHRIGFVAAGEASLFLRVAGRHRREAFRASQWMVDELKRKVPIWKRPRYKIDNRSPAEPGLSARANSIMSRL